MLDLAFQFSTDLTLSRSQISVCVQWDFQPTRGGGSLRCGCTLTLKDEKWQWVIATRGTPSSGVDDNAITTDKPGNHRWPTPSPHSWRDSKAPLVLHCPPPHGPRSSSRGTTAEGVGKGKGATWSRKTPYQYILMTGDKWASSLTGLFAVHKST